MSLPTNSSTERSDIFNIFLGVIAGITCIRAIMLALGSQFHAALITLGVASLLAAAIVLLVNLKLLTHGILLFLEALDERDAIMERIAMNMEKMALNMERMDMLSAMAGPMFRVTFSTKGQKGELSLDEMQSMLKEALDQEDYEKAAQIKQAIEKRKEDKGGKDE